MGDFGTITQAITVCGSGWAFKMSGCVALKVTTELLPSRSQNHPLRKNFQKSTSVKWPIMRSPVHDMVWVQYKHAAIATLKDTVVFVLEIDPLDKG